MRNADVGEYVGRGRQRMTVPVRAFFLSSGSSVNSPTTSPFAEGDAPLDLPL